MSKTPRVTLRAPRASDADALFRIAGDLDTWEERGATAPAPLTRAAWDERNAKPSDDSATRFVIEVDAQPVGSVLLYDEDPLARHAAMGITLLPEARNRGIGTAAIEQVVEFAFVRRNLRRLHLEAIASNAGALRAYEKVGFVEEGRQREHAWVRGRYEDIVRMGLLRSEWPAE